MAGEKVLINHSAGENPNSISRLRFCNSLQTPVNFLRNDFKTHVDQACRAAEEFVNIYYETMDKRRRALTRLYLDKATLIWNGNVVTGLEALTNFFEMLPSSEFQVNMLDCQPVHEQATQAQTTVLVVTSGTVKFDGNKQHYFNQNFLLTAQSTPNNTVWKIASDCFRFQDWASS
ncbi:NTF2-related export protein 2 isoform X2 [Leptonychotes weddellii]|uniref:NTF2-related export protein 2 isoform X2 n=1 Tax=Leptonychotes weddellii TaxID=9713 RepID=A0A7F8R5V2_LEPWE|nr:NTF2-related export protein 2 isoform X2 [Leptonychotes weddellii]